MAGSSNSTYTDKKVHTRIKLVWGICSTQVSDSILWEEVVGLSGEWSLVVRDLHPKKAELTVES